MGQESKVELQNDVNIELLGRCLLYSFSYQRLINPTFGLELGMSVLGGSNSSILFFTGGCRIYLLKNNATPCISGGIVVVTAPSNSGPFSDNQNSTSYGYIGPGFEYRSPGGFILRGTVYFLIRDGFFVWPGAQVGVAF
jgi:hypothetical protein